jgi:hypothetical protein
MSDVSKCCNVRKMASNSLQVDNSALSSRVNSFEYVNSGSPYTECDANAKSDTLLAITALRSWILLAGIFLSSNAVASYGRIDDKVMPVC